MIWKWSREVISLVWKKKKKDSVTSVKAAEGGGQCWNQAQNENLTIILETLKQFKCPLISNK